VVKMLAIRQLLSPPARHSGGVLSFEAFAPRPIRRLCRRQSRLSRIVNEQAQCMSHGVLTLYLFNHFPSSKPPSRKFNLCRADATG
jgi:hypothetical protein